MNELNDYLSSLYVQLESEKRVWRLLIKRGNEGVLEYYSKEISKLVREIRNVEKEMGRK